MKRILTLTITGVALLTFCFVIPNVDAYSGKQCSYSKYRHADKSSGHQKTDIRDMAFYKATLLMKHKDEIGLTDAQVDQIKDIKLNFTKSLIRFEADKELLAIDIKNGLYERPIDVAAVNALVDQKYEIKKAKTKASVQALADIKNVVSDDQWTKFKEVKRDGHKRA